MKFDIKTTYNYLTTVDDYTYKHYCSKNRCITCPFLEACDFLSKMLSFLEETIDKEKIV
jgi:hypothetical protein